MAVPGLQEVKGFSNEELIMAALAELLAHGTSVRTQALRAELEERVGAAVQRQRRRAEGRRARYDELPDTLKLNEEEQHAARTRPIMAIKLLRERTGLGLKESKDVVELFRSAAEWGA